MDQKQLILKLNEIQETKEKLLDLIAKWDNIPTVDQFLYKENFTEKIVARCSKNIAVKRLQKQVAEMEELFEYALDRYQENRHNEAIEALERIAVSG